MLLAASLLMLFTPTLGFAQDKCAGLKMKAAVKKVTCKAGLEAKHAATGKPIDVTKVAKCESGFSKTFAKIESKAKNACRSLGDEAAIETKVDAFVANVAADFLCSCQDGATLNPDCSCTCPNTCLNGGTLNPDCSCICPAGYESLHGGCFRISNTGPGDDCGKPSCGSGGNFVAGGSGNFMCFHDLGIFCGGNSHCPLGSACLIDGNFTCVSQCAAP